MTLQNIISCRNSSKNLPSNEMKTCNNEHETSEKSDLFDVHHLSLIYFCNSDVMFRCNSEAPLLQKEKNEWEYKGYVILRI